MDVRAPAAPVYVFGAYRLTPSLGRLERDGAPVPMTPRVFSTLHHLVENAGRLASKDEMLAALWPGRIADEANLSQAISAVRRALGRTGAGNGLILTVPGKGYRFTAPVRIEPPTLPPPARPRLKAIRWAWLGGAAAVAAAGALALWWSAEGST